MGFFGSLLGWDQTMGAVNTVMASHIIENMGHADRQKVAREVLKIVSSVNGRQTPEAILHDLSAQSRAVQMNFIALACDNLGISPISGNAWTRVKNPYLIGSQVSEDRIAAAVDAIAKQDGIKIVWPGSNARINFKTMYDAGTLADEPERLFSVYLNHENGAYSIELPGLRFDKNEEIFTGSENDCRNLVSYGIAGVELDKNPVLVRHLKDKDATSSLPKRPINFADFQSWAVQMRKDGKQGQKEREALRLQSQQQTLVNPSVKDSKPRKPLIPMQPAEMLDQIKVKAEARARQIRMKNKPQNALDELIFAIYGNPPPPKRANVGQAIGMANELLMCIIDESEVSNQAISLSDGPIPYSTHDLALSIALNFFKKPEHAAQLFEAQLFARMKMLEWLQEGLVAPMLAKSFESTLYNLYKPCQ